MNSRYCGMKYVCFQTNRNYIDKMCLFYKLKTFLVKTLDTQRLYEYICNGNKISKMFF